MTKLYGYVSNMGAPEYDDIMQSDLSTEEKVKQIQMRGQAYRDELDDQLRKNLAKQYAGAALEIGSAAIPMGAGVRLAGLVGKGLSTALSSGLTGGLSGGVFGFGRGLMEDKNPLQTMGEDALMGGLTGLGFGALTNPQRMMKSGHLHWNNKADDVLDITDLFNGTPTEEDVRKTVQDLIDSGKVMDTADRNWKMDIQEREEIRGVPTIDHVVNSDRWNHLNDAQKRRLRKYVQQVEKIINNAKYTNKTGINTKPYQKPDVDKYHYFETQVKVGDKIYNLLLDAEQYIGDSIKKPQTVHLYNIKEIK